MKRKILKVYYLNLPSGRRVPQIRLQGRWLSWGLLAVTCWKWTFPKEPLM